MISAPFHSPVLVKRRLTPAEAGQRLADALDRDTETGRRPRSPRGVQRVVMARHRHHEIADHLVAAGLAVADQQRELGLPARDRCRSHSRLLISDISTECGFEDSTGFSVVFTRETDDAQPVASSQFAERLIRHADADDVSGRQ